MPYSLLGKLEQKLQELEEKDVIQKVDRPTPWVNSLVIVKKTRWFIEIVFGSKRSQQGNSQRAPQDSNSRERSKSAQRKETIVDEKDGFWQVPLDNESSHLCMFNTQYGRYRLKRMPFGIKSAPEIFQKKNEKIFGHIRRHHRCCRR